MPERVVYRRTARYVIDLLLLVSVVAAVITGFIVDRLDLHQFRLHAQAGYAMAALVVAHLVMHWRPVSQFRSLTRRRTVTRPVPASGTALAPEPEVELEPAIRRQPRPPIGERRRTRRAVLRTSAVGVGAAALGWFTRAQVAPNPYDGGDVGVFYHQESSTGPRSLLRSLLDWGSRPAPYKTVDRAPAVALPTVSELPTMSLADALEQRRSLREYADRPVTADELAWLVRAGTGITSDGGRRSAPSAGALYPIETYVAVDDVAGIDPGLYHVGVRSQSLEPVRDGSVSGDLTLAGLGQDLLGAAPVVFVLTGVFQRSRWKYQERHYRYVVWEAGHVAQNLCLAAESADMGACVVGSFLDGSLNDLLRIDGRQEAALGLVAVGPR